MTDTPRPARRRTVLRAAVAGTAAALGLGATGTATASSFLPGDCVRLTIDVQAFTEACPNGGLGPYIEAGEEGTVWETCTTSDGHTMIKFLHTRYRTDSHWVSEEYFEHC